MKEIYNKIISVFRNLTKHLSYRKFINAYTTLLSAVRDVFKVSMRFIGSIFGALSSLFSEYLNLEIKQIFKWIFLFSCYSKIIVIISSALPVPAVLKLLATEYLRELSNVTYSIIDFLRETAQFYYEDNVSKKMLESEQSYLRELLTKQSEALNKEKNNILHLEEKYASQIAKLQAKINAVDATNKNLFLENSELIEKMKTFKTTTKIETFEKYVMIGGNIVFIGVQLLNGYNKFFGKQPVDPEEVANLIKLVKSLLNQFGISRVNQVSEQRARAAEQGMETSVQEQQGNAASTPSSSRGLTEGPISYDDEFGE